MSRQIEEDTRHPEAEDSRNVTEIGDEGTKREAGESGKL